MSNEKETVLHFKNLHPMNNSGIVWLLDAAKDQQVFIERVFTQSGLLNNIVDAQFDYRNGDYETALRHLEKSAPMAFELAELLRIDIFLEQQETEKGVDPFGVSGPASAFSWLSEIETAYQQRITILWGKLALQNRGCFTHHAAGVYLTLNIVIYGLQQLLIQFDQASVDDLIACSNVIWHCKEIQARPYSSKVLWLKLMARLPEMSLQHEDLAFTFIAGAF